MEGKWLKRLRELVMMRRETPSINLQSCPLEEPDGQCAAKAAWRYPKRKRLTKPTCSGDGLRAELAA